MDQDQLMNQITPTHLHKQQIQETVSRKKYILNIDKFKKKKKFQAAKRQRIDYAVKGGGTVATLDAVAFKMFRFAWKEFSDAPKKQIIRVDAVSAKIVRVIYSNLHIQCI